MKIAYLHGLESNIDQKDPKIIFLNKNFDNVYAPSINYKDDKTFNKLYKNIKSLNPDLIVGSSMGGYVSYLIGSKLSIPVLLFNPAMVGRTFDPVVDDSGLKKTRINIRFGKSDSVISGSAVRSFFKENGVSFNHERYNGGHRVPEDVFIDSIKGVLGMDEVNNKTEKPRRSMKHVKLFEEFTANKVTCDNCDWNWQLEEGGRDVFLCHKCGHDNTPILGESINESHNQSSVEKIIKRSYPKIVKHLGGKKKPVEVYHDIYSRLGAVGIEDLMKQNNPSAEYSPLDDTIYIYWSAMHSDEEIIRSLLHEHTHTLQDQKMFKKMYDDGFKYNNHPFELAALASEEDWQLFK